MAKLYSIIGFILLAAPFASSAQGTERIDQLDKEIQEIRLRLSKLESLLTGTDKTQQLTPSGEGWKSIMNWRKLSTGMAPSEVQKILGEPLRADGGVVARWHYQNGGAVMFYEGKVRQWEEPRQ